MSTPRSARFPSKVGPALGRRPLLLIAAVAWIVSFIGFGWTVGGYFLGDDFGYIERFFAFPLRQWPELFTQSWAGNMWGFQLRELRPITALSFMIDGRIWAGNATGFRISNLLLHASCATLVGWLAWRAAGRELACGVAAALLFALHPVHAEPVQWITGRVDVFATLLYLCGFVSFLRFRTTGALSWAVLFGIFYAAAAFAKEFGLTLPLMCLLADLCWRPVPIPWRRVRAWIPYLAVVLVVLVYFGCRRAAFGADGSGAALPDPRNVDFQVQFAQRQLTYLGYLFPFADRWLAEDAPAWKQYPVRVILLVAAGAIVIGVAWRWLVRWQARETRRGGIFFALAWYAVATFPLVVTYISPRHLYLASAGVCVATALLLMAVVRSRVAVMRVAVVVAVWFVPRLKQTMLPWHEASVISGQIASELRRLEPELRPGGALLLDVPEIRKGAYVWTWAVPFVLRPPFLQQRWDDRLVVLESRGQYVDWERWHEQPAISRLGEVREPSWIIHASDEKPAQRIPVPLERLPAAAKHFAAEPLKEHPHEAWRKLIDELTAR